MVSSEQAKAIDAIADQYPHAYWIVALHHHPVEYPKPVKKLSERIGTALINGSWLMRHLGRLDDHAVVMHGHRHDPKSCRKAMTFVLEPTAAHYPRQRNRHR
jgi:predicted phosphodiesterase